MVVTLISIVLGWVTYELNWIRERNALAEYLANYDAGVITAVDGPPPRLPWLFGESGFEKMAMVFVDDFPDEERLTIDQRKALQRTRELYPEATVMVG